MRKIFAIFGLVLFITLLTACSPEFNGSSTGNDTQFIMEYSILNKSDYRNMTLKSGDIINTILMKIFQLLILKLQYLKMILINLQLQDIMQKEV